MHEEFDDTNEEIEEIRELLYDLIKDYPTGVTSQFLEEQYDKKYVQTGITKQLPKDWLRYAKQADEFEIKQLSTFTMLYLVNTDSITSTINTQETFLKAESDVDNLKKKNNNNNNNDNAISTQINKSMLKEVINFEIQPLPSTIGFDAEPMSLQSMPVSVPAQAHIVLALDPENIYLRLCSWDPVPDYLYSALLRNSDTEHKPPTEILPGKVFAVQIDNVWERVKIVRKSEKFFDCWILFAIDVGFYHIVHESNLRPLSEAVTAFKKIFLARIKLSGLKPISTQTNSSLQKTNNWSREIRQFIADKLVNDSNSCKNVEIISNGEWIYDENLQIPFASARLIVDGIDFNQTIIDANLATNDN